ncbi:tail tape measure protein [Rhizobium phage RHph_I72]|nr:tail tape measure protein [Rhizobium phage RHph_I65]QIG76495.1 tail tape measure protein [Rhizobium phage RHph_I72]
MAIADELIALLGYEVRGEENIKRYNANLDATAKRITALGVAAGVAAGWLTTKLIGGIKSGISSLVDTNAQFETISTTLLTIEGSADKAKSSLAWIQQFAKTTPYDLASVSEAFVKLKAYGIDPVANDTLKTLGDSASAMGKPLNAAIEMFSDAATFQFERMKEFGVTSSQKGDQVTFSWTKNGQQMTKVVKKNSDDIRKFVLENLGERFLGAMDKQSKTWTGLVSNIGDTWTGFQKKIGEAGFFDKIKDQAQKLLDTFQRLQDSGKLDLWAKRISNALSAGVDIVSAVAERIGRNVDFIIEHFDKIKVPLEILGALFARVLMRMFPWVTFFFAAGLAVDDFLSYLQGGDSVIGGFIDSLSKLINGDIREAPELFRQLATGIAALAGAGVVLFGFQAALSPVTAALLAFAAAFKAAQVGLEYLDKLDKKVEGIKAVPNPRDQPGYIEPDEHDANGNMLYRNGAAIVDRPLPPNVADSMTSDALDWKEMMTNLEGNIANSNGQPNLNATVNDNKQDNRQFPMTNNVTINQTVTQPSSAPGAAATATGNAVSGAIANQRSQIETEPSF